MTPLRWWILALAAVAALAFSAGRWSAQPTAPYDPLRDVAAIQLDWLDLTAAQAAEIETIEPVYRSAIQTGCDEQCASRCRLVNLLTADTWDPEKVRQQVEAMCAAHRANEMATLDYLENVRRILNPEQRARLMERIGTCLCERCAMNGNLCCAPEKETR